MMKRAVYFQVIICFLMGCQLHPDIRASYKAEYFCFDGYRGIGVVSVPVASGSYAIPILAEPMEGSNQTGTLLGEISSDKKAFSVESTAITKNALFEFAYEHLGLPVELIQDNWMRVRIGTDAQGNSFSGWVSITHDLIVEKWDAYLPDRATFIAICDKPTLYETPYGESFFPKVNYQYNDMAKTKRPDYRIYYLERDGDWMKVQFVTPSNLCGRTSQQTVVTEGWIPFLLEDKSPAVWFYPRGC